nr:right-handed parallel beta-helix repeat-containing protein [bacterium]
RGFQFYNDVTELTILDGFTIVHGFGDGGGGGIECWETSPVIRNCIIEDCEANWDAGGILLYRSTSRIENCIIRDNVSIAEWENAYGGGVSCWSSAPVMISCLVSGNRVEGVPYPYATQGYGGGIFLSNFEQSEEPVLINCTVVDNEAVEGDYGGILTSCDAIITNCISWNNAPGSFSGSTINITYSDMPNFLSGEGNINEDPLFITAGGYDYLLSQTEAGQTETSPCVDSGSAPAMAICFGDEPSQVCLDKLTTRSDFIGDAGPVDMGFHLDVEGIVTPTPSPTPPPSPTPTPHPTETPQEGIGLTLLSPGEPLTAGAPFSLTIRFEVTRTDPLLNTPLFCFLDITGTFFFYPGWTAAPDWDIQAVISPGTSYKTIIPVCSWPDNAGSGHAGIWAAVTDSQMTRVLGEYDFCVITWN